MKAIITLITLNSERTFIQSLFPPCGDFMSKMHTHYTIQIYIKESVTVIIWEVKKIYIHVRKNGKARKKGVIKRVKKGTLFYTTCATALL